MRFSRSLLLFLTFIFTYSQSSASMPAKDVFSEARGAILQVRIINITLDTQSSIGSGFFITSEGYALTNYHVVSAVVQEPSRYRAEFIAEDGSVGKLSVVNIDIINDLALIKADFKPVVLLEFAEGKMMKGERLFSIGNPQDLGITIVEGTFSGVVEDSLYQRMHFTGSLNPGMSGGPTLNSQGRVVGVNLATAGNQISFLVLAERAQNFVLRTFDAGAEKHSLESYAAQIRKQLFMVQDERLNSIFNGEMKTKVLGNYSVPGEISSVVNCWGNRAAEDEKRYEISMQKCSVNEYIYLSSDHILMMLEYTHKYVSSVDLNPMAFYHLISDLYSGQGGVRQIADEEDVTNFECESGFVNNNGLTLRVSFCLRGFKKYTGIYDVLVSIATLDGTDTALLSILRLGGVSLENALQVADKYIRAITWAT